MQRQLLAAIVATVLFSLSGCATVSVTAEVADDNTLDRYEMNISTSTTVYGYLNEGAKDDGYNSLEDQVKSGSNFSSDQLSYQEEIDGDRAHISIELTDVEASELNNLTLDHDTDSGELVYEDTRFLNESASSENESEMAKSFMSGIVLEYTLVMPGEITASNADEVDGNTATWKRTGSEALTNTTVHARSEAPSDLSVPGFGAIPAMAALIAAGAFVGYRRWQRR